MKVKLQTYVTQSDRSVAEIAEGLGFSEQKVYNWLRRKNPIFVKISPSQWEKIQVVTKEETLYREGG